MVVLQFIYAISAGIFSIAEFLLGARIFLKLFGASPYAPFVSWIYQTTEPLLAPFVGIFPNPQLTGFILEFSTLFALIIYALIGYFVTNLISNIISQEDKKEKKEPRRRS
jgi:uncharacterized protein YggT (Ycf19 family)